MENKKLNYLKKQVESAENAAEVLTYTYKQLKSCFPLEGIVLPPDTLERFDALTSRFSRLSDILLQKVFRAIDAFELIDEGSLIDRLHRAEKRGVINSADLWRDIRELRNQIAHDYVLSNISELFSKVYEYVPELLKTLKKAKEYITILEKQ